MNDMAFLEFRNTFRGVRGRKYGRHCSMMSARRDDTAEPKEIPLIGPYRNRCFVGADCIYLAGGWGSREVVGEPKVLLPSVPGN